MTASEMTGTGGTTPVGAYLEVLRRRWAWVAGGLVLCVAAAALAITVLPRTYEAETTIYVSGRADGEYPIAVVEATLSRMPSYRQLLTEDPVLEGAIAELRLAESPDDLRERLVVDNEPQSLFLKLSVTDGDPEQAARIANGVAQSFVTVAASLDQPAARGEAPVVSVKIANVAGPPTDAVSPQPRTTIGLGVVAGLLLGVVAAFARDVRGSQVRSVAALTTVAPVPHLGGTARRREAGTAPLAGLGGTAADVSDFRRLAMNLRMVDLAHAHKVLVVTGIRPATGTTTTACNLAIALAAEGNRVALVDADLTGRRIADIMRVESTGGLTAVVTGQVPLREAIHRWSGGLGLDLLDAGQPPPSPLEFLRSPQMTSLIEELRSTHDVVLFDTPAVLDGPDAAVLAARVDGAVLCCRSGRATTREVRAALDALDDASARVIGTVLTHAPSTRAAATNDPPAPHVVPPPADGRSGAPGGTPWPARTRSS